MKSIKIIVLAAITVVMASCGTQKQAVQVAPPPAAAGFGVEVTTPCVDASYDDAEFFRGLGTGTAANIGNSRKAAMSSAQSEIQSKLGGLVKGLVTDYNRTMAGDAGENTQRAMEGELTKVVDKALNDASKVCEKTLQDQRGVFNTFIVFEISKTELIDNMANSLSDNEELKIEFNRDQFRKFAAEKEKAMREAQSSN